MCLDAGTGWENIISYCSILLLETQNGDGLFQLKP